MNEEELKLRKELYWVYQNILENLGNWNIEEIKKRLNELRYFAIPVEEKE